MYDVKSNSLRRHKKGTNSIFFLLLILSKFLDTLTFCSLIIMIVIKYGTAVVLNSSYINNSFIYSLLLYSFVSKYIQQPKLIVSITIKFIEY